MKITCVYTQNCTGGVEDADVCACDSQCAIYGDCCRSSPYFVPEQQRLGASPFQCTTLFYTTMYVLTKCPPEWKDPDTRNRCEHPDTNYSDPLLDAPVTSYSTNITYRNWHCASCHRDLDANTTAIWQSLFKCTIGNGMPFLSVSGETSTDYLSYDAYNSQWNFNIDRYHLDRDPGIFISDRPGMQ
jgi:hypothetical protein